ncbi:MAG: peptidylprolyl isomerase [Clostridia bacterium]|nr:peptidylprolyl isomerase [Clostridia bacterium]
MFKTKMKRILCGALALSATVACTATLTACETSHPKVEMEIEFNGQTYELEYKLYRKIAPATVKHFLALAENGYYDGLCVHDYTSDKLYTGGYTYENENLVYKKYYDIVKNYADFPVSVWTDETKATPTYTLYGEFYENADFTVENGALDQTFGSLSMFYTEKDGEDQVVIERHNGEGVAWRDYENNCATSLFFISLASETKSDDNYCTFATLDDDSVEALEELKGDIEDYIAENYSAGDEDEVFAPETTVEVDGDDPYVGQKDNTESYHVPQKAIVIKKVTVKKY